MNQRPEQFRCRHIFTDGRRCGSASLRAENFCFYHDTTRRPAPRSKATALAPFANPADDFQIAMPEDRHAVQHAIGEILRRVAANQLDSRRAALLLYGLQIASSNLPRADKTAKDPKTNAADLIDEVVADPELGPIAPIGPPLAVDRELNTIQKLLLRREVDRREIAEQKLAIVLEAFPDAASALPKGPIAPATANFFYDEKGDFQWKPEVYNLPSAT